MFFYVDDDNFTDDDVIAFVREWTGIALVPKLLHYFPRHRWKGAQITLTMAYLWAGTHGLFDVIRDWLQDESKPQPETAAPATADDGGYASEPDVEMDAKGAQVVNAADPAAPGQQLNLQTQETMHAEFNKQMKMSAVELAAAQPRVTFALMTLIGEPLDRLLNRKLFLSGEQWTKDNEIRAIETQRRGYRVVEMASNRHEHTCGRRLIALLNVASSYSVLRAGEVTQANRGLAFRLLSRALAALKLLLITSHSVGTPRLFHDVLGGHGDGDPSYAARPRCLRGRFADEYVEDHPDLYGPDSVVTLMAMAIEVPISTMRSEMGHADWQRIARIRSQSTHADTFTLVNATVLPARQRKIEQVGLTAKRERVARGRPKKKKQRKTRAKKDKRVRKRNHSMAAANKRGSNAYNMFVRSEARKRKGSFGSGVFAGISAKYRALEPGDKEHLVQSAHAHTHARFHQAAEQLPSSSSAAAHPRAAHPRAVHDDVAMSQNAIVPAVGQEELARRCQDGASIIVAACKRPYDEGRKLIEKHHRDLARDIKDAQALREGKSAASLDALSLCMQHPVAGVSSDFGATRTNVRVPNIVSLDVVNARFPALGMAKNFAKAAGEPRTTTLEEDPDEAGRRNSRSSLHLRLRQSWLDKSLMTTNDSLPRIGTLPQDEYEKMVCKSIGVHICDRPHLLRFRLALLRVLNQLFKKGGGNKHKGIMEEARGVLQIHWVPMLNEVVLHEATTHQYFHVSVVNQNSWACCFMELYEDVDLECARRARNDGNIALTGADIVMEDLPEDADIFEICRIEVVPCQFMSKDLSALAAYTLHEIVETDRDVASFVPRQMEVRKRSDRCAFWPGSVAAAEAANKSAKPRGPADKAHLSAGSLVGGVIANENADPSGAPGPSGCPVSADVDDDHLFGVEFGCPDPLCEEPVPEWLVDAEIAADIAEEVLTMVGAS